jgi:Asp-tRNA(Asn)/Glu-tRNA(Gln) amidotransferase A subunit family amidase
MSSIARSSGLARRDFLGRSAALALAAVLVPELLRGQDELEDAELLEVIRRGETLAGLSFTDAERDLMRDSVREQMQSLQSIRALALSNEVPPALGFRPLTRSLADISHAPGSAKNVAQRPFEILRGNVWAERPQRPPADPRELVLTPVMQLAEWIRRRHLRPSELLDAVLFRLRALDPTLHFTIDILEESARAQAAVLDEEQRVGKWRGPLHGIPYGAKDLLATRVGRTTWGAKPYEDQRFDFDAEVVRRLEEAGAILVAKTSVGALAWGDVWYAETTRNPWNPEQGSSGSSAGSSSAVAAGALPFALGTETLGSIVSPCARCGATGIRPTFGRVPRSGCMALTWSMDKIGPIARNVEDAALVLEAIHGADGHDHDAVTAPLQWFSPRDLKRMRFGWAEANFAGDYPEKQIDAATLDVIRGLGVELVPVRLPELPVGDMLTVLSIEAAAAFDELTRTDRDDLLVRQVEQAWPNVFRAAQLATGVQYVQAQRARTLLQRKFEEALGDLDGYVAPSFAGPSLLVTNLTGHPCVVMPNGFREDGTPTSISFNGRNFEEGKIVALAAAVQNAAGWNRRHPPL